jgi:hypothetical protein
MGWHMMRVDDSESRCARIEQPTQTLAPEDDEFLRSVS